LAESAGENSSQDHRHVIATRSIEDDFALLYSNKDFDPFVQHLDLRSVMWE
jgi:hypothetical protein